MTQLAADRAHNEKLSLKERLIRQKQERLNADLMNKEQEKRFGPTSMAMPELSPRPQPGPNGNWPRASYQDPNVTDAFKRTVHNEIEALKNTAPEATNIGPGASSLAQETFKVLRSGQRQTT